MSEISNKTLAVLIGIAIMVSVVGILSMPKSGISILGAVTNISTGTANVSIQSVTQIRLNNNTVDFGVGFVNSTDIACILESNSSGRFNSTGGTKHPCDKAGGGPGFNAPAVTPNFVIENIGNVNVTLRIAEEGSTNTSDGGAQDFLCPFPNDCLLISPELNWSAAEVESGSCDSDPGIVSRNRFNDSLNRTGKVICSNFDSTPASNEIRVPLRVRIPRDTATDLYSILMIDFIADTG